MTIQIPNFHGIWMVTTAAEDLNKRLSEYRTFLHPLFKWWFVGPSKQRTMFIPWYEIRLNLVWCSVDELNSRPSNDRNHIQRLNTKSQIFIFKKVKSFVLIQRPSLSPSFLSCNRKDYDHIFFQCAKHLQSFPVIFLRLFPERGKPGIRIKLRMTPWWPLGTASILDSGNPWEVIVFLFKTNFESLKNYKCHLPTPRAPPCFPLV